MTHPSPPNSKSSIPKTVVSRLSLYLREVQHLVREDSKTISSRRLGERLGLADTQVRKDLAHFGQFGYPGVGYRCEELSHEIKRILGLDRQWNVVLIGAGNLGKALSGYKGFSEQGFRIVAAFDIAQERLERQLDEIPVYHLDELANIVEKTQTRMAIIAVPAEAAQEVGDRLVAAGIEGIMNFAPVSLNLPDTIQIVEIDLSIELEQLTYAVVNLSQK